MSNSIPILKMSATCFRFLKTADIEVKEVISEKDFDNYVVTKEVWSLFGNDDIEIDVARNKQGEYIGDPEEAKMFEDMGIIPEKSKKNHCVCSIGFCEKEQKWYGWSHRAMHGFGIGDTPLECYPTGDKKGKKKIKTLKEAKQAAIDFAESVS